MEKPPSESFLQPSEKSTESPRFNIPTPARAEARATTDTIDLDSSQKVSPKNLDAVAFPVRRSAPLEVRRHFRFYPFPAERDVAASRGRSHWIRRRKIFLVGGVQCCACSPVARQQVKSREKTFLPTRRHAQTAPPRRKRTTNSESASRGLSSHIVQIGKISTLRHSASHHKNKILRVCIATRAEITGKKGTLQRHQVPRDRVRYLVNVLQHVMTCQVNLFSF